MLRGLIFDFDGLILDTETPEFVAWQEVYREYGLELPLEQWTAEIGADHRGSNPYLQLERLLGYAIDHDEVRQRRRKRAWEMLAQQSVLPGVVATLQQARQRGVRAGVASSSTRAWVGGHLERLALTDYFTSVICVEDVSAAKPSPELYLTALSTMGLTAHEAIAFEDSPNGITAAKRAGLFCVAVPNPLTRGLKLEAADVIVSSLDALPFEQLCRIYLSR